MRHHDETMTMAMDGLSLPVRLDSANATMLEARARQRVLGPCRHGRACLGAFNPIQGHAGWLHLPVGGRWSAVAP
jgi:hypothetical protein